MEKNYHKPKKVQVGVIADGTVHKVELLKYNDNGVIIRDTDNIKMFIPYHNIGFVREVK